jgi:hypothetical protein
VINESTSFFLTHEGRHCIAIVDCGCELFITWFMTLHLHVCVCAYIVHVVAAAPFSKKKTTMFDEGWKLLGVCTAASETESNVIECSSICWCVVELKKEGDRENTMFVTLGLYIVYFQITRGCGQLKCMSSQCAGVHGNVIAEDSDPSGATGGNIFFRIWCFLQNISGSMHTLGFLMHKDAKSAISALN